MSYLLSLFRFGFGFFGEHFAVVSVRHFLWRKFLLALWADEQELESHLSTPSGSAASGNGSVS